jgi:hypothetical protein
VHVVFYSYANARTTSIAYPQNQGYPTIDNAALAGQTGSYDTPLTVGANSATFAPGTRVYFPYLQKYGIVEDSCPATTCTQDPSVRVWIGGDASYDASTLASLSICQSVLAQGFAQNPSWLQVTVNPPATGLTLNKVPLFRPPSGQESNSSCTQVQ